MSTSPAQLAANAINAQSSTGPRTPEGLQASSQNATTIGLYATRDFVRPGEESALPRTRRIPSWRTRPVGLLEYNLVDEIRRAMWRLRRCGEVEETFTAFGTDDPMRIDPGQTRSLRRPRPRTGPPPASQMHRRTSQTPDRTPATQRILRSRHRPLRLWHLRLAIHRNQADKEHDRNLAPAKGSDTGRPGRTGRLLLCPATPARESGPFCKTSESPAPIIPARPLAA